MLPQMQQKVFMNLLESNWFYIITVLKYVETLFQRTLVWHYSSTKAQSWLLPEIGLYSISGLFFLLFWRRVPRTK